jgi:uncharacterized CHY-type Zn-finger protein
MELDWADAIDTACAGCGEDAVDWVQVADGTRRYACEPCLTDLLRHGAAEALHDLPDTPNAVVCPPCQRFTLKRAVGPANRCPDCTSQDVADQVQAAIAETEREQTERE